MEKRTLRQKLQCPYCKGKQEFRGRDYFAVLSILSFDIQCDHCDEKFNAKIEGNHVVTYSNLTLYPPGEIILREK